MRKRISAFVFSLVGILIVVPSASAAVILTDKQITTVEQNCSAIKTTLQRLQQSDRLLRVNLGQRYDSISRRLMAPLNGRIAINGLNGIDLSKTTIAFNVELASFQSTYRTYDSALSDVLRIDCRQNPVEFYAQIVATRDLRKNVNSSTARLNELLMTYRQQFEAFATDQLKVGAKT